MNRQQVNRFSGGFSLAHPTSTSGRSPSSEEPELSPSPVLVNTWLREDSRSFSYSPSTSYGSYSYTSPRGGVGYGNIDINSVSNAASHHDHDPDSGGDSAYGAGKFLFVGAVPQ